MKRSSGSRKTAELSKSILQQLNMYTRAAGAAGVGVLALSQSAAAKTVYTPAHINLGFDQVTPLDLNHDGITDFSFYALYGDSSGGGENSLFARPGQRQNAIVGHVSGHSNFASALRPGAGVGKARAFVGSGLMGRARWHSFSKHTTFFGPWANGGKGVKNRYLGLKFLVKGKVHYGWARLTVTADGSIDGTLTGYAYETIPGKSIIAGQTKGPDDDAQPIAATHTSPAPKPPTLAILAVGAPGLSIWRREDPVAATSDGN